MMPHGTLDGIPLWGVFVFTWLLVLIAVESGFIFGRRRHGREAGEQAGAVGTMVGSTVGLLAFMLAFAFSFASSRVDVRRTALTNEANAVGTTYLRAEMLSEPHRSEVRKLLREDVDLQLEAVSSIEIEGRLARLDSIHNQLWQHAAAVGRENPQSEMIGLFVESLNESIEQTAVRLMAYRTRVSTSVWFVLYTLTFFAILAMGYHMGLTGTTRSPAVVVMAVSFALVICLVADLDRPHEGRIRVNQQPLIDLQTMMRADTH